MNGESRYWLMIGAVGWGAVALIAYADIGLQRVLAGAGFPSSPAEVVGVLTWVLPGILFSPLAVILLRRLRPPTATTRRAITLYVLAGIAFWVGWATTHTFILRIAFPSVAAQSSLGPELASSLANNAFNSLILFSVIAVLFEATLQRREAQDHELRMARLRSELSQARTAALAAKLDPHFLFNTLHVASGLMYRDRERARQVLVDLRELISASAEHQGLGLIRFDDELTIVERYLRIQKARFDERLRVEVRIDAAARACLVPPLLLQPLVENALQHGISKRTEGGWLRIVARVDGDRLHIEVANPEARAGSVSAEERIGLGGVRARLDLLFGDRASLRAARWPIGEFSARIELPATAGAAVTATS